MDSRPKPAPRSSHAPHLTAVTLAWLAITGCSDAGGDGVIPVERVVLPLLDRPELRHVVEENSDWPVQVDIVRPRGAGFGDYGPLPAIEVTPPCEVRFDLPDCPAGSRLSFAAGILRLTYRGSGAVRFEFDLEGERLFETTVDSSESVEGARRRWWPTSTPIEHGGELVVRTRFEGDGGQRPRAALAELRVAMPIEIERASTSRERPNLILVVVDTLRADRLHVYGNPRAVSPNLDRLAERGTRFDRAYVPAPWTIPSTASILTGLSPSGHGLGFARSNYLASDLSTIAETLQEAGVTTAAFSSNPLISRSRNFDQGFESFHEYRWRQAPEIIDDVLPWLDANAHRRFFLYVHAVDPHNPYEPDPDLAADFDTTRPEGYSETSIKPVMDRLWAGESFAPGFLESVARFHLELYDGEVASVDRALGRLFAHLGTLGLEENTVIAVTSDHGEEFLDHGLLGHKNQLHEELVRVPLIVAGPGVPRGALITERVEVRFLAPTLLALAGVAADGELSAPSLLDERAVRSRAAGPVFFSTSQARLRDGSGWRAVNRIHGVRSADWLLFWVPGSKNGPPEARNLFDLASDPEATRDVAHENPRIADELRGLIQDWVRHGDERRPEDVMTGAADEELMRELGYIGDDHE